MTNTDLHGNSINSIVSPTENSKFIRPQSSIRELLKVIF